MPEIPELELEENLVPTKKWEMKQEKARAQ
jgi:hypothetical protein